MLLSAIAISCVSAVNAGSVSPWVIDDPTDVSMESRVRMKSTAFAASDFAPVIHFSSEVQNSENPPKPGTNRAMGIAQAGVYFDYQGFQVGIFRRMDAYGLASSDAITVIQTVNGKTSLDSGRPYYGNYSYLAMDMEGIRLGKAFKLPMPEKSGWSAALGVSFSPLHGVNIWQDSVSANIYSFAPNSFLLDGERSQANSKANASDYNAYLQNGTASANGYTSDFGISLQHTGGVRIYLISDVASKLNWHSVPARNYSVQGYTGMPGTPLPSGFASTAPFSRDLERKTTVGLAYATRSFVVESAVTRVNGLNDPTLAVKHALDGGWSAQVSVHPYWHALGMEISHPKFGTLRIISDNVSIRQARALGLAIETGFSF